jgi:hypothetical protein
MGVIIKGIYPSQVQVFEIKNSKIHPGLGFRNPRRDSYEIGTQVRVCD